MNPRRIVRSAVLFLFAAAFGACHFHGGCHSGWSHHCHVPVRHCR